MFEDVRNAAEAIRANPLRSVLTTLGVVIGVLSVILLVSVGDGARKYLGDQFAGIGMNLISVSPGHRETTGFGPPHGASEQQLTMADYEAIVHRLTSLDGASPIVQASATMSYEGRQRDSFLFGVGDRFGEIRNMQVDRGQYISEEDLEGSRRVVVLGHTIVRELFGDDNPLGKTMRIAGSSFRVIGIMASKGTAMGFDMDDIAMIPATVAIDMFDLPGVNQMLLRARDRTAVPTVIEDVKDLLRRRHRTEDFTVVSQEDLLKTVDGITATMTLVLLAIASISLLVGGIGIMNIMLVSVRERTREIGVRRAVGARKSDILRQFLTESIVISLLGGTIGLALGATIIFAVVKGFPALPVRLSPWIVGVALGFSALVGVASGVVPARRAAGLDPVEALRYE